MKTGERSPDHRADLRADVQGLRGVAVLLVVLFHAGAVRSGFIGVDIFFVISGYIITRQLLGFLNRERVSTTLRLFYWRRVCRLTPALSVLVIACSLLAVGMAPIGALRVSIRTAVSGLLLTSNLRIYREAGDYFATKADDNVFLHFWSLSVEEQFYLAFPALLGLAFALGGQRLGRWLAYALVAGVAAVSFTANVALSYSILPSPWYRLHSALRRS